MPRNYPTSSGTYDSKLEHLTDVRRQVGHAIVWNQFYKKPPTWRDSLSQLNRTTPKESERPEMSAVRIVLPTSWSVEVKNLNLEYVDSVTGVLQRLRASPDKGPSSIILRGKSTILSKAVNDIIKHCDQAKVYELGSVAASDYKTKQLWPTIETGPDDGAATLEGNNESIWLHKEPKQFDITQPYEKILRPEEWTQENFTAYITTLCYSRVPSHLAIKFYGERKRNGRYIDTEGVRIGLITSAFENPQAQQFITAPLLKMALSLMAFKGGHRAEANKIFLLGEKLGVPMDTDTYNIMLEGYVAKRDPAFFYGFLRKMEANCFYPNITTWLLFLRLVRGVAERKQIIVAMYELGMLQHAATRRGIANIMASADAYRAFKAGKTLDQFLADQKVRYGKDWLSAGAVNGIMTELLRFDRAQDPRIDDCKRLIEIQTQAGLPIELTTINLILRQASKRAKWKTALWAVSLFKEARREPNADSYTFLIKLAIKAKSPHSLGTIYFYGVLNRKLKMAARTKLSRVLLRLHEDAFWHNWEFQPNIFPKDVIPDLLNNKVSNPRLVMSRIERAILDMWEGYTTTQPFAYSLNLAYLCNDLDLHRHIRERKANGESEQQPFLAQQHAIKLRRLDGTGGQVIVRLTGRFNPKSMLEGWAPKCGTLSEEQHPPAAPNIIAASTQRSDPPPSFVKTVRPQSLDESLGDAKPPESS